MTSTSEPQRAIHRVIPVFAAAFALIYVLAVENNWAVVTYHPKTGDWEWLTKPSKNGPAMHWFGWVGTALLGAAGASLLAVPLTGKRAAPVWLGWVIPMAVMVAFVYLLRGFFLAELRG
jgi:hypothetical protein